MAQTKNPVIRQIKVSDEDLKTGITSLDTIQAALEDFHTNGFVVLENAVPHSILDKFSAQMQTEALTKLADTDVIFNHDNQERRFSMSLPLSKEWLHKAVWANRHAVAVMEHIIGPKPQLTYVSSNILLQSKKGNRQAVHCDAYAELHDFPVCIEVFVFLEDVSIENGSTELWPGSHKGWDINNLCDHGRGWVKKDVFRERAEISPPLQPTIPKGSICLRDIRLWHAGMANYTTNPRIMLGFIYYPAWFRSPMRLTLPEDCKPVLESWTHVDVLTATNFVVGTIEVQIGKGYIFADLNFTQDPEMGIQNVRPAIDREQGREENSSIAATERDYWMPPPGKKERKSRFVEEFDKSARPEVFDAYDRESNHQRAAGQESLTE